MKMLSPSMHNYIKAIYELSSGGVGVRGCDIAEKVGVSKASACTAVKNLERKGFVYRDDHRLVYLSKEGEIQKEVYLNKSEIIHRFLRNVLDLDHAVANTDARAMENIISLDTLCALCCFTNRIDCCTKACGIKSEAPDTKD